MQTPVIDAINALSTTAVALFALVELVRASADRREARERQQTISRARIAVSGENVQRLVGDWIFTFPDEAVVRTHRPATHDEEAELLAWLNSVEGQFPTVEALVVRMIEESVYAPRPEQVVGWAVLVQDTVREIRRIRTRTYLGDKRPQALKANESMQLVVNSGDWRLGLPENVRMYLGEG